MVSSQNANSRKQHQYPEDSTVTTFDADQSFSNSSFSGMDFDASCSNHNNKITMSSATPSLSSLEPEIVEQVLDGWKRAADSLKTKNPEQQRRAPPTTQRQAPRRHKGLEPPRRVVVQRQEQLLEEQLGQVLLQRATRLLTPAQYSLILGETLSSSSSNDPGPSSSVVESSNVLLRAMASHLRAVRIGNLMGQLVQALKQDVSEFRTLLCTFWRQQRMMGWNLQVSQLIAVCQTLSDALGSMMMIQDDYGDDGRQDDDDDDDLVVPPTPPQEALAQFFRSVGWELEQFDKALATVAVC